MPQLKMSATLCGLKFQCVFVETQNFFVSDTQRTSDVFLSLEEQFGKKFSKGWQ